MTFADDFCQINFDGGTKRIRCHDLGIDWPPPEILDFEGFEFTRVGMSRITDEQRSQLDNVCRGAEYSPSSAFDHNEAA